MPAALARVLTALCAVAALTGCMSLANRPAGDALSPGEHLKLGVAYEHDGKADLALREYERAAVGPLKSTALTCQGNIYLARQDRLTAEAKYRQALGAGPDNIHALNNLAWLLAQDRRSLDEAERLIRYALELNPEPRADYEDTLQAVLKAAGN